MNYVGILLGLVLGAVIGFLIGKLGNKAGADSSQLDSVKEDLAKAEAELANVNSSLSSEKDQKQSLETKLAVAENEVKSKASLEKDYKELSEQSLSLQTELASVAEKFKASEESLKELRTSEEGLKRDRQILQDSYQEVRELNAQNEEKLLSLEKDLEAKADLASKNDQLIKEKEVLAVEKSRLKTQLEEQAAQSEEKLKLLEESKQTLKVEFQNLANKIFEEKSEKFTEVNKEKLDTLINPFKEQIKDFAKKVDETYDKESKERISLKEQITQLQQLNNKMSDEANNLTKALKGEVKTQGSWGEMILEKILEGAGLREGIEFRREVAVQNEEGKRFRPDVIVHLPEQRDVIIDSKVSLVAYERYMSATDEEEKAQALAAHVASVKSHVKLLSEKNYEDLQGVNNLDYVLLFMPVEGAFRLAVENDENLMLSASKENIMLISPSTLLISLRTIHSLWQYEYQNQNARKIAERAGALYDKFVAFVKDLEDIGKSIERTNTLYNAAHNKLVSGRGNVIRQTQTLIDLGVKSKKTLPAELLNEANQQERLAESKGDDQTLSLDFELK